MMSLKQSRCRRNDASFRRGPAGSEPRRGPGADSHFRTRIGRIPGEKSRNKVIETGGDRFFSFVRPAWARCRNSSRENPTPYGGACCEKYGKKMISGPESATNLSRLPPVSRAPSLHGARAKACRGAVNRERAWSFGWSVGEAALARKKTLIC